jgi:hypothetical protein
MLVGLTSALAAPGPMTTGTGLAVSGTVAGDSVWLWDEGCTQEGACEAVRTEARQGVTAEAGIGRHLGAWIEVAHVHDQANAASYEGDGWGGNGGVRGRIPLRDGLGFAAWAGGELARTTGPAKTHPGEASRRWEAEVGAAFQWDAPDANAAVWLGGDVVPLGADRQEALEGALELELRPYTPAEAVAGILLVSDPLGSPWARARLRFGLAGRLGYRSGLQGWLGASF